MKLSKYTKTQNKMLNYYYLIALLLSLFFTFSIFYDIFQIHIYRHDSLYYMAQNDYLEKISSEGRWLNYIFFPILKSIPGNIWSIFVLSSFSYFTFISAYRWTQNVYYSGILALLFLQIPSFYDLIQWPAVVAPVFFILLLAIYLANRLPLFIFYILFSILFFATMSNYYYLLPLLHLSLLNNNDTKENIRILFFKIIPAWAIGFVFGYVVMQIIVYVWLGHTMQIAAWRNPHYIHSLQDIVNNMKLSYHALEWHIKDIFSNKWLIYASIFGVMVSFWGRKKDLFFLSLFLFISIILIHYLVVLPVGIKIDTRTIVATWVGVFAIIFFIPIVKQWKIFLLTPIIILFTYNLYLRNHHNLQWYTTITNTHYDMLLKTSPMPPQMYDGVVLFSNDRQIQQRNDLISKKFELHKDGYIEKLREFWRWATSAKEAGFKHVINCNKSKSRTALYGNTINAKSLCQEISISYIKNSMLAEHRNSFLNLIGVYNNMMIISFDNKGLLEEFRKINRKFQINYDKIKVLKPIILSEFDIYQDSNELIYYKKQCTKKDLAHTFFLRITPMHKNDLPKYRQKYGFQKMHFNFYTSGGIIKDNICITSVTLPNFSIKAIHTGQYEGLKKDWHVGYFFEGNNTY